MTRFFVVNTKTVLYRLCFLVIFLISCNNNNEGEWIISELPKDTLLTAETKVSTPSKLILNVTGYASDSIEVHSIKIPGGKINEELSVDYYRPNISIRLKSYKAKEGKLKIGYYLP